MKNPRALFVMAGTAAAGVPLLAYVMGFWSLLLVPTLQIVGAETRPSVFVTMAVFNVIGALFVAALLSIPLGFVVREPAWVFGAVVGAIVVGALAVLLDRHDSNVLVLAQEAIEALALIAGCALFTSLLARLRRKKNFA